VEASKVIQHVRGTVLTDRELVAEYVNRRDEVAFATLVRRHGPMVWSVCRRLLGHHDAEDAFQATFLVFARKAAEITSRELLANWLYGVARQTALRAHATATRRKCRERQVSEMHEPPVTQPELPCDLLDEELLRLPERYRAVIVLCDLEGHTRQEAARQLRCPEGTVAGRLARARAMLAKRLTRHGLGVLGGTLASQTASAGVPPSVVSSTIRAVTSGQPAASVIALTEGVLKAMTLSKLKKAVVALLVAFALLAGAAVMSQTPAGQRPDPVAAKARVRWEYRALPHDAIKGMDTTKRGIDSMEGGLNALGEQGWELVAIEPAERASQGGGGWSRPALYVFKRQKQ
jgi:RNA polymerase sigma factor (sigma-70 family)